MPILDIFKSKKDEEKKEDNASSVSGVSDAPKKAKNEEPKKRKSHAKPAVTKKKSKPVVEGATRGTALLDRGEHESILLRPIITEKSSFVAEKNAYTFEVSQSANKIEIAKAVKAIYDVVPHKVRIIHTPRKRVFYRGKPGFKAGKKKAIVFLEKGQTIEFV